MTLSDSQLVVLTAACQRSDRCVFPVTAKLKGNAAGQRAQELAQEGTDQRGSRQARRHRLAARRAARPHTLVATKAAFAALGIDLRDEAEDNEGRCAR